ncbi:maltokinase N-terminal cap-like domain-containing protein [Curtobacterium sp. Leaf261]|uniref:maltokinase N-terminal cap-like domain-containing protein n=1 Tax=Curtobacterium sp. Leaf261 TaxID=1736311 RepID=UPI0006F67A8B|nr:hypothetical protein [Curtobacterium sp. Leaf261]KQO59715.1 hypothetical protein ASF23_15580 [Curtobacterium sp. Leaf261]
MALLHRSTIVPGKLDLAAAWIGRQPWWTGGSDTSLTKPGAFRLDDPEGRVGIEFIVAGTVSGALLLLPLTYRDAPLEGAEAGLLGTMEHSVLGTRWTYDAAVDPVALAAVIEVVRTGGTQAREMIDGPDGPVERVPSVLAHGSVRAAGDGRTGGTVPVLGIAPASDVVAASDVVTSSDAVSTTVTLPNAQLVVRRLLDGRWTPDDATGLLSATWGDVVDVPIVAVRSA